MELAKMLTRAGAGEPVIARKLIAKEYFTTWMDYLDHHVELGSLRPETANWYKDKVNTHLIPGFGGLSLAKLGPNHIEDGYSLRRKRRPRSFDDYGYTSDRSGIRFSQTDRPAGSSEPCKACPQLQRSRPWLPRGTKIAPYFPPPPPVWPARSFLCAVLPVSCLSCI